ncbi:MAG: type II secretion system F family protein [Phycisphaerales bacterium]|nr:type II secretion system F family protein [Phycisphaerales bacterium]
MSYTYEAYDSAGALQKGVIEAASVDEATELLRAKKLFVSSIAEGGSVSTKKKRKLGSKRVSSKTIAMFARELAVLVSTGTPILDAIASLKRQSRDENWIAVLADVQRRLEEGDSLSVALEAHSSVFDAVFRSLVSAGESSGHLDAMLTRLAILTRRQAQIKANISGAMVYPILLTGISLIVLGVMIGVVLPRFSGLFETLDTPLPPTTKILMSMSDIMRSYWWGIIPVFIGLVSALVVWLRSESGTDAVGTIILKTPNVGDIYRQFNTARITRLMGVLLEAHVPMLDAIHLTRQSVSHRSYRELLTNAEDAVTKGETISSAFDRGGLIVPSVVEALRNGEQSGRLGDVLNSVSDYLDEENETIVRSISSIIEPVIMIILGIFVGIVAISMFLPLFDLTASTGGGG